jgi:hypothetical protein
VHVVSRAVEQWCHWPRHPNSPSGVWVACSPLAVVHVAAAAGGGAQYGLFVFSLCASVCQSELVDLHDKVLTLADEVQSKQHKVYQLESSKEQMNAIASQHTAAADTNDEEAVALKAAIETNNDRITKLRKQRQEMEVRVCVPGG